MKIGKKVPEGWYAGRTAIVTGGGSGIGASIGRALVEAGATVVLADLDGKAAETVAASLSGPGTARGVMLDVTRPPTWRHLSRRSWPSAVGST
jgi:NAD(P)-dependent dehydrogenase (short-subunit alcohol dehydrogenase family)